MANIFKQNKDVNNHVKRNNFDLSFQNHLTLKFGNLYPVFCKEVVPGDSFRIKSAFGLKFMPMVFPVQSKMRAHMHFFYVRNKNLWDRWEDWISGLKGSADGVEHPYIKRSGVFNTGSLLDYMNVPTTIADGIAMSVPLSTQDTLYLKSAQGDLYYSDTDTVPIGGSILGQFMAPCPLAVASTLLRSTTSFDDAVFERGMWSTEYGYAFLQSLSISRSSQLKITGYGDYQSSALAGSSIAVFAKGSDDVYRFVNIVQSTSIRGGDGVFDITFDMSGFDGLEVKILFYVLRSSSTPTDVNLPFAVDIAPSTAFCGVSISSISDSPASPFEGSNPDIRLNALPFRAYESIVNCFFRNNVVDPFKINGVTEYNKFITENGGGADSKTPLDIAQRNYEFDFLTSCSPSPQQGVAPLVGISALGSISVTDENGNVVNAQFGMNEDNQTFNGKVSIHNPNASITAKQYLSQAGMALAGLSINDFRNVNALQKFLEVNIRKGYRYMDFIEGHFGKSPKYNELDMPEYIGGFSREVTVSQILQTSDMGVVDEKAGTLGSFAGIANCFGGTKHDITHYCDDYGFIIGILCVTPTPSYSQLLPKMYLKSSNLDYYFPEFANLGLQSVSYEEVAPLSTMQARLAGDTDKKYTDTFGYQRPNYDLVSSVDEVHGQFRTSLRDFLISRYFAERPVLGRDFIKVKNEDASNIFSVVNPAEDNILGQVIFQVYAKRPIPRIVIPSLGR